MTDSQRRIFSEIVDLNYQASIETNRISKMNLEGQVLILKSELMDSMGEKAYDKFMANGKAMFAPKED